MSVFEQSLLKKLNTYHPISDKSWVKVKELIQTESYSKNDCVLAHGKIADRFYFVYKGVFRAYYTNVNGDYYTKNLFLEDDFAGSTVSYLTESPSEFTIECLENDSILLSLDVKVFRKLIFKNDDLQKFYISYLERNWIIKKEKREVSIVMDDAKKRYEQFIEKHPNILNRIASHHIASHLGITPTQLSRIRRK